MGLLVAAVPPTPSDARTIDRAKVVCHVWGPDISPRTSPGAETRREQRKPRQCLAVNDQDGDGWTSLTRIRYKSKWGKKQVGATATFVGANGPEPGRYQVRFLKRTKIKCQFQTKVLYLELQIRNPGWPNDEWHTLVDRSNEHLCPAWRHD